jgi:hypothetical protein
MNCIYCSATFRAIPARRKVCPACVVRRNKRMRPEAVRPKAERLLAPLATRPFKPASLAVLEGVEKFRALRRAFLRDRDAALTGGGDCADKMGALDRCEIAYRLDKEALFRSMRYPTRQAVWSRL